MTALSHAVPHVVFAAGLTILVPVLGYMYLGPFYAVLFAIGYVSGFLLWLVGPTSSNWHPVRGPYTYTVIAFVLLHEIEESRMKFFDAVSARITHDPVPEASLGLIVALVVIPVGAWLIAPILFKRRHDLGRFLLWTLFASVGFDRARTLHPADSREGALWLLPLHGEHAPARAAGLVGNVADGAAGRIAGGTARHHSPRETVSHPTAAAATIDRRSPTSRHTE